MNCPGQVVPASKTTRGAIYYAEHVDHHLIHLARTSAVYGGKYTHFYRELSALLTFLDAASIDPNIIESVGRGHGAGAFHLFIPYHLLRFSAFDILEGNLVFLPSMSRTVGHCCL